MFVPPLLPVPPPQPAMMAAIVRTTMVFNAISDFARHRKPQQDSACASRRVTNRFASIAGPKIGGAPAWKENPRNVWFLARSPNRSQLTAPDFLLTCQDLSLSQKN